VQTGYPSAEPTFMLLLHRSYVILMCILLSQLNRRSFERRHNIVFVQSSIAMLVEPNNALLRLDRPGKQQPSTQHLKPCSSLRDVRTRYQDPLGILGIRKAHWNSPSIALALSVTRGTQYFTIVIHLLRRFWTSTACRPTLPRLTSTSCDLF
jgi:hypothetical protein